MRRGWRGWRAGDAVNHWPFIIAAYGLTAMATFALLGWSVFAMHRAERALQKTTECTVEELAER